MILLNDGTLRGFYLTDRIGVMWIAHSHRGWYAVRIRIYRHWDIEVRGWRVRRRHAA